MTDDKPLEDDLENIRYNLTAAHDYYKKFIYNAEHQALLANHNFHVPGSVPSRNWEVFAAILTGDDGKGGYGSDLTQHEVKSSIDKNSFEYQYHLHGGKAKLIDDMKVNHIFISYSADYRNIEVRIVSGKRLQPIFESWMPALIENYEGANRKQRFRKSIPYGLVQREGLLVLKTKDGELVKEL